MAKDLYTQSSTAFKSKRYGRFKSAGLCRRCGKKPMSGMTRCRRCHDLHLEYGRKFKHKAIRLGLCLYCCKNPRQKHRSMCSHCLVIHSARQSKQYANWRAACIKSYGGQCVCCGCSNTKYLQLDHVNNDGAKHRREMGYGRKGCLYKWACANGFPKRLQLMCANCHQAKTNSGGCTSEDHPPFASPFTSTA